MANKKDTKKKKSNSTGAKDLLKATVLEKITEHNRDYFKLDLTLPLGNTALKNVHTNQWLFTTLPKEFDLANWTILAEALNSKTNRLSGYVKNRWYIESNTITVDVEGNKAEMKLGLNAFPSSYSGYSDAVKEFQNAYNQAGNNNNNDNKGNDKNTSNAIADGQAGLNQDWIKKYNIPSQITKIAESVCKGKKTDKDKAYALYEWMDSHVGYEGYTDHLKSETQVINDGRGNCVDNSRVYRLLCLSVGIKCNFVHGYSCCAEVCANHQWNKVFINGQGITVDCGRDNASWGSHWGSCSGGEEDVGENSW